MRATRTSQPYRKGPRMPGAALNAMLQGRAAGGAPNAADVTRMAASMPKWWTNGRSKRPGRAPRPARPPR